MMGTTFAYQSKATLSMVKQNIFTVVVKWTVRSEYEVL